MSHHFGAKGGTHFNFNSDGSGDVRVHLRAADIVDPHTVVAEFPCSDLVEFVDYYRREYREEEAVDGRLAEQLTDEERENLERAAAFADAPWCRATATLLRIHDHLKARVTELEREQAIIVTAISEWVANEQGPVDTLDTIAAMCSVFAGTRDLSARAPLLLREIVKGLGSVLGEVARGMVATPEMIDRAIEKQERARIAELEGRIQKAIDLYAESSLPAETLCRLVLEVLRGG